jgi:DNA-binding transcriptional ArsR family regulator
VYFQEVLYPLIQKFKLEKYYKKYRFGMNDETLAIGNTFGAIEVDRIAFIDLLKVLEIEQFFAEEIVNFYGGMLNIPSHPQTGEPLIPRERPTDLLELLQNPRRHTIESLLVEGYSPKQISDHLFQRYDMEITPKEIKTYAKSFFNVKRHDIQRLLDSLVDEKEALEEKLFEVKRIPPDHFSYGERFEVVSAISGKIRELNTMIKKLSGVHLGATFNAAVLEVTDMREMFKDVMVRAHRRYREMDERTEDEIVQPLNSIVNMMAKATDKIIGIDDVLNQKSTKTINEEMLEVIMPTLDRIEKEEKEAMFLYKQTTNSNDDDDDDDIIGLD